jgi:DNA-binding beta-propeller fold protein YncE
MAEAPPSRTRSRSLRAAAVIGAVAAIVGALKLGGAFDDGNEPVDPAPLPESKPRTSTPVDSPFTESIEVGGHPAEIAVGETDVFVLDATSARLSSLDPEGGPSEVAALELPHPANSIAVSGGGIWLGYPEQRELEHRAPTTGNEGETIELDAFPSAIEADEEGAWVLVENGIDRVEQRGEVTDHLSAGGFSTAFDVADGAIWLVADHREVRRFDASSLEPADEIAEVPDASAIAVGEGYAWVLSATGEVTRLDTDSLRRVGEPVRVPGALAIAAGEGAVWVTSADGTLTRVDPGSGETTGRPTRVGDEPGAIATGQDSIWVANAGDGTVTRMTP